MNTIYKIISPTNKIYVGQTIDYKRRIKSYNKLQCTSQPKIYNSLKKYGPKNHIFEIIEECDSKIAGEREKYWKIYYNTITEGLNCRLDEEKGGKLEESICNKISKAKKGVKHSKEHCDNISLGLKGNTNARGASRSKETRELISKKLKNNNHSEYYTEEVRNKINTPERAKKISEAHKGKKHPRTSNWSQKIGNSCKIPIIQYDLEDNFIQEWDSAKDAGDYLGKRPTSITACCKNKQKTAFGYKWKYKNG